MWLCHCYNEIQLYQCCLQHIQYVWQASHHPLHFPPETQHKNWQKAIYCQCHQDLSTDLSPGLITVHELVKCEIHEADPHTHQQYQANMKHVECILYHGSSAGDKCPEMVWPKTAVLRRGEANWDSKFCRFNSRSAKYFILHQQTWNGKTELQGLPQKLHLLFYYAGLQHHSWILVVW